MENWRVDLFCNSVNSNRLQSSQIGVFVWPKNIQGTQYTILHTIGISFFTNFLLLITWDPAGFLAMVAMTVRTSWLLTLERLKTESKYC